jgi:hypothetical protein
MLIRSIMVDSTVFDEVADDGVNPDYYMPAFDINTYLAAYIGRKCIGVFILEKVNSATIELHGAMLPEFRLRYSIAAMTAFIDFLPFIPDKIQKLQAFIPVTRPNVRDYLILFGFKHEGFSVKSYRKNGKLVDRWLLGCSRKDLERFNDNG